jgi:hypothetical protein
MSGGITVISKYGSLLIIIVLLGAVFKDENFIEIIKVLGISIAVVAVWCLIDQFS